MLHIKQISDQTYFYTRLRYILPQKYRKFLFDMAFFVVLVIFIQKAYTEINDDVSDTVDKEYALNIEYLDYEIAHDD